MGARARVCVCVCLCCVDVCWGEGAATCCILCVVCGSAKEP